MARKSTPDLTCDVCNQVFHGKRSIQYHVSRNVTSLICDLCPDKDFRSKQQVTMHIHNAHLPKLLHKPTFTCDLCDREFSTKCGLVEDLKYNHLQHSIICDLCDQVINRRTSLVIHMNKLHPHKGSIYCKRCGKTFSSDDELLNHAIVHKEEHFCDHCGKEFGRKFALLCHIESRHLHLHRISLPRRDRQLQCDECGTFSATAKRMARHVEVAHLGLKLFTCKVCPRIYTQERSLKYHQATRHQTTDERPTCDICEKDFSLKESIAGHHIVAHFGKRKFKCRVCGAAFSGKMNLNRHMARHSPAKLQCDECDKKLVSRKNMAIHWETIHTESGHVFKCSHCGAEHSNEIYLRNHISHIHKKPFNGICDACGKMYKYKSVFNNHVTTHTW